MHHPQGAAAPAGLPTFGDLGLHPQLLDALAARGYTRPTPIQAQAIPPLLEGRDVLGIAQTGTGKTAAFALPILDRLVRSPRRPTPRQPRVLVLTPTRELASQVRDSFAAYGAASSTRVEVIFGGVGQGPQVSALRRGVDVLVATPGRLLDLIGQRHVDLGAIELFVLDEADRMLDMGFLRDVKRIVALLPQRRHSLLFSATMPTDIAELAASLLHRPVRVEVAPPSTTAQRVEQGVWHVRREDKRELLARLLADPDVERALVFTRTKHGADKVARALTRAGLPAAALHGNKSQGQRERALQAFRDGQLRTLVATDIAARGIDVPGITHVINHDVPNVPETYVHRIGRTARAGRAGIAVSLCDVAERPWIAAIERETGQRIPVLVGEGQRAASTVAAARPAQPRPPASGARRPRRRRSRQPATHPAA
ncbi:MAG: DEAD/DEAH box helicase [Planctomycetota bacterium]